jgi:hypothetical protein
MKPHLAALVCLIAPCAHMYTMIPRVDVQRELVWITVLGAVLYTSSIALIPRLKVFTLRAGLKGKDLCKKGTPAGEVDMYACMQLVSSVAACVWQMCLRCCAATLQSRVPRIGRRRHVLGCHYQRPNAVLSRLAART